MEQPMPLPLELVLRVVETLCPKYPNVLVPPSHPITQTLLSFTLVCHATRRVANRCLLKHCVYLSTNFRLELFLSDLANRPELCKTESLFFDSKSEGTFRPFMPIRIYELFGHTSSSLKRLVISLPSLQLLRYDELCVINEASMLLDNLEECVLLAHGDQRTLLPGFWVARPKIRRLALVDQTLDRQFWSDIANLPQLETLVLISPHSMDVHNWKAMYFVETQRPLKVIVVNVARKQIRSSQFAGRKHWDRYDPQKKMTIMTYDVPMAFEDDDELEVCDYYVRVGAENGTLWDWEGEIIPHPPVFPPRQVATSSS